MRRRKRDRSGELSVLLWAVFALAFLAPQHVAAQATFAPLRDSEDWSYESDSGFAHLGYAVESAGDVNGDGFGDVVAGATLDGSEADGAAYVFLGGSGGIATTPHQSYFEVQTNDGFSAEFGFSLTHGDFNADGYSDVVVGAPQAPVGAGGQGLVRVYYGSATGLPATPSWEAVARVALRFGHAVAAADLDGDGYDELVVGAPFWGDVGSSANQGAICVWRGGTGGLGAPGVCDPEGVLGPDNADARVLMPMGGAYWFGWSIEPLRDSSDGPPTPVHHDLIVGAPLFGSAFVIDGRILIAGGSVDPLVFGLGTDFRIDSDQAGAGFAYDVANAGDVDGDGRDDPIVGSYSYAQEGRAFLWLRNVFGTTIEPPTAYWTGAVTNGLGSFGYTVDAIDLDADGLREVVVGDRRTDAGGFYESRYFAFAGTASGPSSAPVWSTETVEERLIPLYPPRASVAGVRDVTGDGFEDLLIGSPGFSNPEQNEGRIQVWYGGAKTLELDWLGAGAGRVTSDPPEIDCTASCDGRFADDTVVTLTATPDPGSVFDGWGGDCAGTGPCVVTMSANRSVTASFSVQGFVLDVAKDGTGTGDVVSSPAGIDCGVDCSQPYPIDTFVFLTATPAPGSVLSGWTGDCFSTFDDTCRVRMQGDRSVTATFDIALGLALAGSGGGRVVSAPAGLDCDDRCTAAFAQGTVVTLTADPDASSVFAGFSGDPDCADGLVQLDVSRSCVAVFSDLAEAWSASFEGPDDASDSLNALALAPGNDLAVTGSGGDDIVTIRYDAAGNELWAERWDGPSGGRDFARAVVGDALGNTYVAGSSEGATTGFDIITLKYLPDGTLDWAERYDGPSSGGDFGYAIGVDALGRVFVGGGAARPGVAEDFVTLAYAPDGTLLWDEFYGSGQPFDSSDEVVSLAVDSNGEVVVAGDSFSGLENDIFLSNDFSDYATVKYDADGTELWARRYDGPDMGPFLGSSDFVRDLALGPDDSVHVTGRSESDAVTVKYLADGTEDWVAVVPNSRGEGVIVDAVGNVYVTGQHTTKYDVDGVEQWSRDDGLDARDVAVDATGSVFVVGARDGAMAIVKYDADGNIVWEGRYRGAGLGNDLARFVVIDPLGRLSVAGTQRGESSTDYLTYQYQGLACNSIGAFPPSTASLAAFQDNTCEDWAGVSQPGDDLQSAVLLKADLSSADLSGANLSGANLADAGLASADLSGADLTGANVTNADFSGALYDESTTFPLGGDYATPPWGLPLGQSPWALRMIPVPEPGTSWMLIAGAAGLLALAWARPRPANRLNSGFDPDGSKSKPGSS